MSQLSILMPAFNNRFVQARRGATTRFLLFINLQQNFMLSRAWIILRGKQNRGLLLYDHRICHIMFSCSTHVPISIVEESTTTFNSEMDIFVRYRWGVGRARTKIVFFYLYEHRQRVAVKSWNCHTQNICFLNKTTKLQSQVVRGKFLKRKDIAWNMVAWSVDNKLNAPAIIVVRFSSNILFSCTNHQFIVQHNFSHKNNFGQLHNK